MREVRDKNIVIIGAARSGVAAAMLLKRKGAKVFVTDLGAISPTAKKELETHFISFEEGEHSERAFEGDFAVVSPGVPTSAPVVQHYLHAGKGVYSEIELASWFSGDQIYAVTGSNGKTTVSSWMDHTWTMAGRQHLLAGNIGKAFSSAADTAKDDILLEISSFQLDHIHSFHPKVSILLNITPDHLDRYDNDMDKYAAAKFRITENQTEEDIFIYNQEDARVRHHTDWLKKKGVHPRLWAFSTEKEVDEGAFVRNQQIIFKFNNEEEPLMPVYDIGLQGEHNVNNGLAMALAARAAEIKNEVIRESLEAFTGVEHRLELVREVDGVRYINDSKATNVNAVWFALDSFNVPLTLIMGGRDKGNDYSELVPLLRSKVHTLIAIGESKDKIQEQLEGAVPHFVRAETMGGAVRAARKNARRGESVLLSPACSSFDMFDNYEHRGKIFKEEVNKL